MAEGSMPAGYFPSKAIVFNDIIIISTVANLCVASWKVIHSDEKHVTGGDELLGNNLFLITWVSFVIRHKGYKILKL